LASEHGRLKVLYVYKDFDTYNGLIETFLILSAKRTTIPFDFEVCVFANKKKDYSEIFEKNGGKLTNLGFRWGSNPFIILSLYKLFRHRHPDIVQTFILKPNLFGITAAILAGVPITIADDLTLQDQAPTPLRRLRDKVLYRVYVAVANNADHVICRSTPIRRELEALGLKTDVSIIPPPFDIHTIEQLSNADRFSRQRTKENTIIGIVARLSEEKRHEDLLKAFAALSERHSSVRLLIIGDGPSRSHLEGLVRQLGIGEKVEFSGFQKNVHQYLRTMDIFVLPSRSEGAGIAIMEAMAWGLPVVASRVGGIPEIVDEGLTGLLFAPGNVKELTDALDTLIEDEKKRTELGERGREKALREFHPDRFIDRHYLLYRTLLDQKRNQGIKPL